MHDTQTEWANLLDDAINWLPQSIRRDVESFQDSSAWDNPIETSAFLKIILSIREADLDLALQIVEKTYDRAQFPGALFLIRARIHFLKGEFDDMTSCLRLAEELNEDPAQLGATISELSELLARVNSSKIEELPTAESTERDSLSSSIELSHQVSDITSDKGPYVVSPVQRSICPSMQTLNQKIKVKRQMYSLTPSLTSLDLNLKNAQTNLIDAPGDLFSSNELNESSFVFGSYLTNNRDPQWDLKKASARCRPNDPTYISTWLATSKFQHVDPVILVDHCSSTFKEWLDKNGVRTIRVQPSQQSSNDYRFRLYDELLDYFNTGYALFTDLSDVCFKRNPFYFLRETQRICIGYDQPHGGKFKQNGWLMNKMLDLKSNAGSCISNKTLEILAESKIYNAGVLGGPIEKLKIFFDLLNRFLDACPDNGNWNMLAFNYAITQMNEHDFHFGAPFVSKFKEYELESDNFIIHK